MTNTKKPFEEMTTEEQLKYYLDKYGTPKETPSLSADDQYQIQSHRLDEYYNAQSEAYKQSKAQQKEDAYVLYQRMQKYMPEYLKSLGMTGLGVSESYASQATNDYQNSLSGIEQAYARDQSALEQEKFDRQSELEAAYATQKGAEQENLYANAYFPKYEELLTELQLEENKSGGYVAPESINKVKQWIESVRSEVGEAAYKEMMATLEQNYQSLKEGEANATNQITETESGARFYPAGVKLPNEEEQRQFSNTASIYNKQIMNAAKKVFGENIPYGTVYVAKNGVSYVYGKDMYEQEVWMKQNGYIGGDNGRYSKD